jgi:hypothetical protein
VTGGNAETLRRYWAEGEGAAKIRWGDPGDFSRCVEHVSKFMPGQAQGYCNLLHKRALGYYPATHAKMGAAHGTFLEDAVALGIATPDVLALAGSWDAMLHPRTPAGQAGGGKFAAKGGGGAGGKGKGAGKGGKGGAKSASAQAAAQAKVIAPQFMAMNPQQRAQFLAKLTDPQLKALLHEVAQGNSNDPATRAALIAIKDQVAARSLTGAKGPTAVNQAKTASAAKTAATKQAAAQKKAAKPTAAKPTVPAVPAAPVKTAHTLGLAVSAATSGDGPAVTINAAQRRVYAKKKIALPDGSFPIPDRRHLRKAILAVGFADPAKRAAVKAHIRRRAAVLGVKPPAGAKKGS